MDTNYLSKIYNNLSDSEQDSSQDPASDYDSANGSLTSESSDNESVEGDFGRALPGTQEGNDFELLVANIRLQDTGNTSGPGLLTKEWDLVQMEEDAIFKDDLRQASGIGRTKRRRRRRAGVVLSTQVRAMIGEGNQAYVDENIPEAIRIMHEVIRIEPRAVSAWSVLAQCYDDLHETEKALQIRIIAAHLSQDPEEWERLAEQSRSLGFMKQALYCYQKLCSIDPTNLSAFWERAALAKEAGELRVARNALLSILKQVPHDLTVLDDLRPLLVTLDELPLCVEILQEAFDHYQSLYPTGKGVNLNVHLNHTAHDDQEVDMNRELPGGGFGMLELLALADTYNALGNAKAAVNVIRRGERWLQGRAAQRFWDVCEDDREYDLPITTTDGILTACGAGIGSGSMEVYADQRQGDVRPGFYPLDLNARHRLAIARIKLGDIEEGKLHASIILAEDVLDFSSLFAEIADVYFEHGRYDDALVVYEKLSEHAETSGLRTLFQVAACRRELGDLEETAKVYEEILKFDDMNIDAKMKLAEVLEILGETRRALTLVYEVIDARKRQPKQINVGSNNQGNSTPDIGTGAGASLFEERGKPNDGKNRDKERSNRLKLSHAQLRELETEKEKEVLRGWRRLKELWPIVFKTAAPGKEPEQQVGNNNELSERPKGNEGGNVLDPSLSGEGARTMDPEIAEKEWLLEAGKLTDTFRETRNLFRTGKSVGFKGMFPRARNRKHGDDAEGEQDRMASRLHLDLEHDRMSRKTKQDHRFQTVDVFRGVTFDEWLQLFIQYAFLLAQRNDFDHAEELLKHLLVSNAYQTPELQDTIRLSIITCAISRGRHDIAVEQSRKLIVAHQFNNEPVRILLASLASGLRHTDAFIAGKLQKHLLREIKLAETTVNNPELLKWNKAMKRYAIRDGPKNGKQKDEEEEKEDDDDDDSDGDGDGEGHSLTADAEDAPKLPTKNNPILLAMYGQSCNAARSYQSALFYLLHAWDYCSDDPVISLSLAIASIGRAMQRQADNRHQLIAQSMAFLSNYRKIRRSSIENADEVEYNFGRAFHQLGLYSHAVRHYERVLEMTEQRGKENLGLAREAAYNLSLIFVITGATPLARELHRKWLSI